MADSALSFADARRGERAMIAPSIDLLCVGGLSVLVTGALLFGTKSFDHRVPSFVPYALTAAITWPHFLSSYRLLYATRERILTYRKASLYFPAALAAYGLFAVVRSPVTALHVHLLALVAAVYLARHYTGQTWGMMASFAHVEGLAFTSRERRLCQTSLNLAMTWQIAWAAAESVGQVAPSLDPVARWFDAHIDPLGIAAFGIGLVGLARMTRRRGAPPPARVAVPYVALFGWYALLRHDPTSLVVVQVAHALQYLLFPLRIEENTRPEGPARVTAGRALVWLVGLVAVSMAVFAGLPTLFRYSYAASGGVADLPVAFTSVFVSFINIHHYFVDGCLYKLRNPAVRRDLFAHLATAAG